jgi:hypothetical protein
MSRRMECPCLASNVRTVNRIYEAVFGQDIPIEDTALDQDRDTLKGKMETYLLDAVVEAADIIHRRRDTQRAKDLLKTFERVFIYHPQLFC